MKYVDRVLGPEERVIRRGHIHWMVYVRPLLLLLLALLAVPFLNDPQDNVASGAKVIFGMMILFGMLAAVRAFISRWTTEIAVTTKRIIFKRGLVARDTVELNLNRVEGLDVRQSVAGRLLNYGTLVVRGTGLGSQDMHYVAAPIQLRNAAFSR